MIGQTFYGPTPSTDDINTFRQLTSVNAIGMGRDFQPAYSKTCFWTTSPTLPLSYLYKWIYRKSKWKSAHAVLNKKNCRDSPSSLDTGDSAAFSPILNTASKYCFPARTMAAKQGYEYMLLYYSRIWQDMCVTFYAHTTCHTFTGFSSDSIQLCHCQNNNILGANWFRRATVCKTCRLLAATEKVNSTNLFSQSRNNKLYKRCCV